MSSSYDWSTWFQSKRHLGHRTALVLQGQDDWLKSILTSACTSLKSGVWLSDEAKIIPNWLSQATPLSLKQLPQRLGQETDFVIFDSRLGFDADALGQASGMIRAGGLAIFLLPESGWPANPALRNLLNHPMTEHDGLGGFYPYLFEQLRRQPEVIWLTKDSAPTELEPNQPSSEVAPVSLATGLPTQDQQDAVQAMHQVAFGHRKRPLLLTADRGRGKSYGLGLGCVELLKSGKRHLTLTAARLANVQQAFQAIETHLEELVKNGLKCTQKSPGLVVFEGKNGLFQVQFQAPDALLQQPTDTDVVLVDEAAHLPLPMLQQLTQQYSRIIFATTLHGYEGSGRGFQLKFRAFLNQNLPGWKHLSLTQPIRWQAQDPLEKAVNQALLLAPKDSDNASQLPQDQFLPKPITDSELRYETVENAVSLSNEELEQLFHLLTQAHYQTRPNDLMQLLEIPNQRLWLARYQHQIVGVLLAVKEGKLNEPDWNTRRFHGHLFPQLLAKQSHQSDWLRLSSWRVQRVAVEADKQSQGIGSQLLQHFIQAEKNQVDYVSTSFGATASLLRFWQSNGFRPVHLGLKRDKASGQHSAALCWPMSSTAKQLCDVRQQQFADQWAWQLPQAFQDLESNLVITLLEALPFAKTSFPEGYWHQQPYESVSFALRQWTLGHAQQIKQLPSPWQRIWIQKTLQNQAWSTLVLPDAPSQKSLEQHLKTALHSIM